MVARVAMHVVRRALKPGIAASPDGKVAAVPPTYEEIQPGTLFDVKDDELQALEEAGAVVSPTDKRAAKFGFGTEAGMKAVQQEEGETAESAAARRRQVQSQVKRTPVAEKSRLAGKATTDPLAKEANKDADLVG